MSHLPIIHRLALLGTSLFLVACGKQAEESSVAAQPAPPPPEMDLPAPTPQSLEERLASLPLDNVEAQASYGLGYNVGMNFAQRGMPAVDYEALLAGIRDGMERSEPRLDGPTISAAFQQMQARAQAALAEVAEANLAKGKAWLTVNGRRPEVRTTASGLQYEVIEEGEGASPAATDTVEVHYHGTLTDGTVFDSSVQRGETIQFGLNQVIKGWTEGLQLMKVGGKYRFFIPPELGYGAQDKGDIPPNSVLIFEVELFGIE